MDEFLSKLSPLCAHNVPGSVSWALHTPQIMQFSSTHFTKEETEAERWQGSSLGHIIGPTRQLGFDPDLLILRQIAHLKGRHSGLALVLMQAIPAAAVWLSLAWA